MLDLGSGFSLRFTAWALDRSIPENTALPYADVPDIERVGAIVTCPHGDGAILFDLPGVALIFPDRPRWTVEQWDPLTLSPSIDCRPGGCECHGYIREGRWANA